MPDTLASLAEPTQPATAPTRLSQEEAAALRTAVWYPADSIDVATREAATAFRIVWETMEELCGVTLDAKDKGNPAPAERHDQLYLLLNLISDRVQAVREHGAAITTAINGLRDTADAPAPLPTDLVGLRYTELLVAEKTINDLTDRNPSEDEESAYDEAQERFIDEPVTTIEGVILKLKRLAAIESYEKDEPGLLRGRLVFGLVGDLEKIASANGVVR